uniref:RAP domain-containing protein n=1 Tax=Chromera velia CCMP2878 TaxID=1169474 RepID=A0A0G4GD21_9ALVE|eukprot:Cvel_21356.t1-p1 / transcript=Cvel_21356.t1 / gene=Cvel_21356 / organism=Chromera_velia_CCMP2878 / gene_product=hypothetical protein / transcript_product=hypothetical protein / location=Cvel_scaffold1996:1068-7754(+) / protein_length=722 / sequence_SO=supercontig / SO=protein_coding / is_pseudo=false
MKLLSVCRRVRRYSRSFSGLGAVNSVIFRASGTDAEIESLDGRGLAQVCKRAIQEGQLETALWRRISSRAVDLSQSLQVDEIARIMKAYSSRRFPDFNLFAKLVERLHQLLPAPGTPSPSSVEEARARGWDAMRACHVVSAMGKLQISDPRLMDRLVPLLEESVKRGDVETAQVARLAYAFARMRVAEPRLFSLVADHLGSRLSELAPPSVANLCSAFGRMRMYSPEFASALSREAGGRAREFGPLEILNFFKGLADTHEALPEEDKEELKAPEHVKAVGALLEALQKCLGPLSVLQQIQVFRQLIRLQRADPVFVHFHLLPSIEAKLRRNRSSDSLRYADWVDLVDGLSSLSEQSETSADLLQSSLVELPQKMQKEDSNTKADVVLLVALDRAGAYDLDIFLEVEKRLMSDCKAFFRGMPTAAAIALYRAFDGIDARHTASGQAEAEEGDVRGTGTHGTGRADAGSSPSLSLFTEGGLEDHRRKGRRRTDSPWRSVKDKILGVLARRHVHSGVALPEDILGMISDILEERERERQREVERSVQTQSAPLNEQEQSPAPEAPSSPTISPQTRPPTVTVHSYSPESGYSSQHVALQRDLEKEQREHEQGARTVILRQLSLQAAQETQMLPFPESVRAVGGEAESPESSSGCSVRQMSDNRRSEKTIRKYRMATDLASSASLDSAFAALSHSSVFGRGDMIREEDAEPPDEAVGERGKLELVDI